MFLHHTNIEARSSVTCCRVVHEGAERMTRYETESD